VPLCEKIRSGDIANLIGRGGQSKFPYL